MSDSEHLNKSHILLILLVSVASFFEGYDFIILDLITAPAAGRFRHQPPAGGLRRPP